MIRYLLTFILVFTSAPVSLAGVALWGSGGISVCGNDCDAFSPLVASDGEGGVYVGWTDFRDRTNSGSNIYAQRIAANGSIAPGWVAGGEEICTVETDQRLFSVSKDDFGGLLLTWRDFRNVELGTNSDVYAQRVLPDGTLPPGWVPNGVPVTRAPRQQTRPMIISDGEGGATVAWVDDRNLGTPQEEDIYAQHLGSTGQPAPGWPTDGLAVCTAVGQQEIQSLQYLVSDGQGGFFVSWFDSRTTPANFDLYAHRLHADGNLATGWPENGLLIALDQLSPAIAPDGNGGIYVGGRVFISTFNEQLYLHHLDSQGTRVAGWPTGGVQVCCPDAENRAELRVLEDGTGGAILAWSGASQGNVGVFANRVSPDGTYSPTEWSNGGVYLSDPLMFNNSHPRIAPDGEGGMFVAWEAVDPVTGDQIRIQHLDPFGQIVEGWPKFGEIIASPDGRIVSDPEIVSDGSGGVIVVWDGPGGQLFAQRYVDDDAVQTRISLVESRVEDGVVKLAWFSHDVTPLGKTVYRRTEGSPWQSVGQPRSASPDRIGFDDESIAPGQRYAYRLGILEGDVESFTPETWIDVPGEDLHLAGFQPNPARGTPQIHFTLPTTEPARVEIFDLRGRQVFHADVGAMGPGRHSIDLRTQQKLSPGVYWIRLTQGPSTITQPGVILD